MSKLNRLVVLDTETTGLEPEKGHRVIEIGAVEIVNRRLTGRHFHRYLNPDREIDDAALEVHGLTEQFLSDKPRFPEVVDEFLGFIEQSELIIHNAAFDVGFLNHELRLQKRREKIQRLCQVTDSLALARHKHPGQKNNLDALCRRYTIDNSARTLHGALLDAEILADVYLIMTGGQTALFATAESETEISVPTGAVGVQRPENLAVVNANAEELAAHQAMLTKLDKGVTDPAVWRRFEQP